MFELPTSVVVDGQEYPIRNKGDYRVVLDCFTALNDTELDEQYRILTSMIIFYEDFEDESDILINFGDSMKEAVEEMFKFFNLGKLEENTKPQPKLVDWDQDQQLIAAAVNNVAKMEIRALPYLHWWTFMGYYMSVGESAFATVVSIRSKMKSGKKLEDYEKKFRQDNPQYFVWDSRTLQDKLDDEYILNLWNSNSNN